jgi:tRNA-dihydrouridine synthase B
MEMIVRAVRAVCPVPLTVKIRAGWSQETAPASELSRRLEDCGVDAITLHSRFARQGFAGDADWRIIKEVKESCGAVIIGNGDIFLPSHALQMLEQTGCDGVMIGRGAVGNPWIFEQILDLQLGSQHRPPSLEERKTVILEHFHLLCAHAGEKRASRIMRGLMIWYSKSLPHSARFRAKFCRIESFEALAAALDDYFSRLQEIRS